MPRKQKPAARPQTKSAFVMALDPKLTPKQVVAKGKAAGTSLSEQHVRDIRWEAKRASPAAKRSAAPKAKRAAKTAAAKPATGQTKAEFVLAQDPRLPASRIVELAKARGISLSAHRVHNIRWAAKRRPSAKKRTSKPVTLAPAKARRGGRKAARRLVRATSSLAPRRGAGDIAGIRPLDLAYAVGRLMAAGRTTPAEIRQLAAERTARIMSLETELAALKGGGLPAGDVGRPSAAAKPRKTLVRRAARRKPAKAKSVKGTVGTRRDGRRFTTTAKVIAARKWQGQYMGHLRQFPEKEKAELRALAKAKGIPAAVGEMKKRLGKK
jgi:hypothetical protein